MAHLYILDEYGAPAPCDDIQKWAAFMSTDGKIVTHTNIGSTLVSTVFLGLDAGFGSQPLLFETMIFDDVALEGYQERYYTLKEAMAGHELAVEKVRELKV